MELHELGGYGLNILYVNNNKTALSDFKSVIMGMPEATIVSAFSRAQDAVAYVKKNTVDVAFVAADSKGEDGIALAKELKDEDINIKLVITSSDESKAYAAFKAGAIDYVLEPFTKDEVALALEKAKLIKPVPAKRVRIKTMPNFEVYIDGKLFPINSAKPKELLAVLVDKNGGSVTAGLAISYLWEDRVPDQSTQSLYRMTCKRLREILAGAGIEFILGSSGQQRFINPELFACDYYELLAGDPDAVKNFNGEYMTEYSWAEDTNARLTNSIWGE